MKSISKNINSLHQIRHQSLNRSSRIFNSTNTYNQSILEMDCVKRQIHNSRRNDSLVMTGIGMAAAATLGVYAFNTITKKDNIDPNRQIISQKGWLSDLFARNFYDGPFQEKMTKREAALILGVRETATVERIKDAHRRVLLLNHPDRGGSAFLAAKINEAKAMLVKGR